jgi:hypothetical protein
MSISSLELLVFYVDASFLKLARPIQEGWRQGQYC